MKFDMEQLRARTIAREIEQSVLRGRCSRPVRDIMEIERGMTPRAVMASKMLHPDLVRLAAIRPMRKLEGIHFPGTNFSTILFRHDINSALHEFFSKKR